MTTHTEELLELADWRRRIAELYADVRRLARTDPAAVHAHWRAVRESLYREHAASPLPPERRAGFVARHFPYDPALRFELDVVATGETVAGYKPVSAGAGTAVPTAAEPETPAGGGVALWPDLGAGLRLDLPASVGPQVAFERAGWLDVPFPAGTRRLAVFWLPEYSGGLFLPFRDATNGGVASRGAATRGAATRGETYGGGRYLLDSAKGADLGPGGAPGTIVVDFNFAYQPSCAWDPRWACPLSPPENRLDLAVAAGEMVD